jgi:hypothetical protein
MRPGVEGNPSCATATLDLMTMVQWGFASDELRDEHGRGVPHAFDRLERALSG